MMRLNDGCHLVNLLFSIKHNVSKLGDAGQHATEYLQGRDRVNFVLTREPVSDRQTSIMVAANCDTAWCVSHSAVQV